MPEPNEGSAGASKWSSLCLMILFVFCCCAASADLGMRDTGKQQVYLANRPSLVSVSPLFLLTDDRMPLGAFNSVPEMNWSDFAHLTPLAKTCARHRASLIWT